MHKFSKFELAYIECMLWTNSGDEQSELGVSGDEISAYDLPDETVNRIKRDCEAFIARSGDLLGVMSDEQSGHDFWLTRNGHGAGFWDRGLGAVGEKLTAICEEFGEMWVILGDDGKVYLDQ